MINNVSLTGRLTKDPELSYTQSGVAVVSFTLAVNRSFKSQSGETEADFILCQAWRKTAETIANYTKKGSLVGIEGRIQTRSYDNQQGQKVYVTEVVVNNFSFLESKSSQSNQQGGYQNNYNNQNNYSNQNQGYQSNQQKPQNNFGSPDPFQGNGQSIDISDDDLPF